MAKKHIDDEAELSDEDTEEVVETKKTTKKVKSTKKADKPKPKAKKEKTEDDEEEDGDDKKFRYFKRIYPKSGKSSGRYKKGPHQAGLKAFNQYRIKCEKSNKDIPESMMIYIQETTDDSKKSISCYRCSPLPDINQKRLKPGGNPKKPEDFIKYKRRNLGVKVSIDQKKIKKVYREAVRKRLIELRDERVSEKENEKKGKKTTKKADAKKPVKKADKKPVKKADKKGTKKPKKQPKEEEPEDEDDA